MLNNNYKPAPAAIKQVLDTARPPGLSLSPTGSTLAMISRFPFPSIQDIAQEEVALAGFRIIPKWRIPARPAFFKGVSFLNVETQKTTPVALAEGIKIYGISWSPNGQKLAFSQLEAHGLSLWVADVNTGQALKIHDGPLQAGFGHNGFFWSRESDALFASIALPEIEIKNGNYPVGPVIENAEKGVQAGNRTYRDLLRSPADEARFENLFSSNLVRISLSGREEYINGPALHWALSLSPNGEKLLLKTLTPPFSYQVPADRFPKKIEVLDIKTRSRKTVVHQPLAENIPLTFGSVISGKRLVSWVPTKPATLYWLEALDGGDSGKPATHRDALFVNEGLFDGAQTRELSKFPFRFSNAQWQPNGDAFTTEFDWESRTARVSRISGSEKTTVWEYNTEDRYNLPGYFLTDSDQRGINTVLVKDGVYFLTGMGASDEGERPYIDRFELTTGKRENLWRSNEQFHELPLFYNADTNTLLISREDQDHPPNVVFIDLNTGQERNLTQYENPFAMLKGLRKKTVNYMREDGLTLRANLYLPLGFEPGKDAPLPVVMWAYPREYKSKGVAAQRKGSDREFLPVNWNAPFLWTLLGYAVLEDVAMPIVGEGEEEPNDTFVQQLVMNARAAVDFVCNENIGQREKIAIGGHSYGAFMTANLLAHTNLFAAGIARSGAYNRTLTPFGFQSEDRTFWQAPEVYHRMSPFAMADKIDAPILLIHGENDNNPGTHPEQSDRFFQALKGQGKKARLVKLPFEGHGYLAYESINHVWWEMDSFLKEEVLSKGK